MTRINFIADENFVPTKRPIELLPSDSYVVEIVDTEVKATKNGSDALNLTFKVSEGPYKNRRFWVMLNIGHYDDAVRKRAEDDLNSICSAIGIHGELDTKDLKYRPLTARVYQTKPKDGYPSKNSATEFRSTRYLYPPELLPSDEPTSVVETAAQKTARLMQTYQQRKVATAVIADENEPPF